MRLETPSNRDGTALVLDAMRVAHLATQHALTATALNDSLDPRARGQVTAALSGALVSLDTAQDFTTMAPRMAQP